LAGGKRVAAREGRAVVFVDEAALYLLPGVVRSYAPRGYTPVLRAPSRASTSPSSVASHPTASSISTPSGMASGAAMRGAF